VVVQETDKALQLSITQLEYCILVSGRVFGNVFMPSGGSRGDQNDWDGAEFVRNKINQLAAIPDKESSEVLQRLLTEGSLFTYQDQLKHSLANQMVIRRNAEYRPPSWAETVESLRGGKPANIADLHALILDQMQTIKKRIKAGNTDTYKAFWRCDSNGKVERPEIEDICRDRFIELLEPSLLPLELHAEPEGHMAAEKRADIIIFGSGSMKLPVECKRDFHADIWTACTNQLEQMYSRDPGAKGYGIYGVFWFGDKRTSRMKNPPGGITKPQSAEELEQALQSLVPQEQQMKIRVVVFDVTPPY
ncbi:Type I restriction-modification system, restriction subunit R, partial [hydrothermal vent metagenome]